MTGPELRAIRKTLGLTQEELAQRLGFSRFSTVSDWETGKKEIPPVVELALKALQNDM